MPARNFINGHVSYSYSICKYARDHVSGRPVEQKSQLRVELELLGAIQAGSRSSGLHDVQLGAAAARVVQLVQGQVPSVDGDALVAAVGAVAFVAVASGISESGEVVAAAGAAGNRVLLVGGGVLDALVGLDLAGFSHLDERVIVRVYLWRSFLFLWRRAAG
ncbi:hypothetical protein PG996_007825 [Apiospora saccharicola]|uniref:Uncharacterized protein n=1 Tax=Apiospora saccharicola TaxID=335842 RepID=A0ABR1UW64_9PEZI